MRLVDEMVDDVTGFGPLEPLLDDETITEVMVNGPNHVYIERDGKIERVDSSFLNDEHVLRIIDRIITPMGRRIDETSPRVDARLPDGSRVNAIIEPLSLVGPVITVRKFSHDAVHRRRPRSGSGPRRPEMFEFLRACIEARLNLFVSGGTGSGKTTTLNVLSSFIPNDERIVTIEDAAELQLRQDHVITLESRPPNLEGEGEITIRQLLRNAMHMRPDRIIVGECRAGEALDMLQAMTTGHDGSLSTGHANTPEGHAPAARDDGPDDRLRAAAAGDPRADGVGGRPDRPHGPPQGRHAQDRQHHRGLRDRGRRDPHPGHLRVRADRLPRRQDRGRAPADRRPADVHGPVPRRPGIELPPGEFGIPPEDPAKPTRISATKGRWGAGDSSGGPVAPILPLGYGKAGQGRRDGLRLGDRAGRSRDRPGRRAATIKAQTRQCLANLKAKLEASGHARSTRSSGRTGRCATRPSSTRSTRSGCKVFPGDGPVGQSTLMPPLQRRAGFRVSIGVIAEA